MTALGPKRRLHPFPYPRPVSAFLIVIATLLPLASAQSSRAAAPLVPQTVKDNLQRRVEYGHVTGVIVGIVDPEGRAFFSAGTIRAGSELPPRSDTLFEIGSISKGFTGTLLADMLVRGEIALDDSVQAFLPDTVTVPAGANPISLLHLATHRSGLPDNPSNLCGQNLSGLFGCYTVERLYEFLNAHTLAKEPNTAWLYSNLGFGLLGHALSLDSGLPYESLLRQRILDPLALADTRITLSAEQRSRRSVPHWGVVPWPEFSMPALEGAGALLSTAADLLTFIEHLSGLQTNVLGTVPSEATLRRAATQSPNLSMALGWLLLSTSAGEIVWHDGSTYGQNAFLGFNRTTRRGVVVLCNNRLSTYGAIQDVGFHLLDSSRQMTNPRQPATVSPETLASYQGRYQSTSGLRFDVLVKHGELTVDYAPDASPGFSVHAESTTRFGAYEFGINGSAIFNLSGAAPTLTWNQNGFSVTMSRVAVLPQLQIIPRPAGPHLSINGTSGFSYEIHSSSDLLSWNSLTERVPEDGEFSATDTEGGKAFFHAKFPPIE